MSDEIQSSQPHGDMWDAPDENDGPSFDPPEEEEAYMGEDGPEPDVFDEFGTFCAEYREHTIMQGENRIHRVGGTGPLDTQSMTHVEYRRYRRTNEPVVQITPQEPEPTTGALATMPTFQHKFPNGETVAAKIHPNGGGVVCEESEIGDDVYISKASTVYKSKIEEGFISRSSISECEIRTSNIIESQLKKCIIVESCCNKLEAEDSEFHACTMTGAVSDSTLRNTFLTGAEVEECKMEFCRLQGSYKKSTLKSCVIIGTVSDCEINNSEITRAQLKGIKGHIADTGRTKRVQYFIVQDKIHVTYRANQSITLELSLTAREFRTEVKGYMERIGALKFNEEARKREIDWLCSNYKIFRKEESTVEESSAS